MALRCRLCLCILPDNDENTKITDEYGKVAEESPIVNKIKTISQCVTSGRRPKNLLSRSGAYLCNFESHACGQLKEESLFS